MLKDHENNAFYVYLCNYIECYMSRSRSSYRTNIFVVAHSTVRVQCIYSTETQTARDSSKGVRPDWLDTADLTLRTLSLFTRATPFMRS